MISMSDALEIEKFLFTLQLKPKNAIVSVHFGNDWNNLLDYQTIHPTQLTDTVKILIN